MNSQISTLQGYDLWAKWYDVEKNVLIYLDELYANHRKHSIQSLVSPKKSALDICCGSGRHLPILEKHFDSVLGLDLSTQMLAAAREKTNPSKTHLLAKDFLTFKQKQRFNFINCSLALMHFQNLNKFFSKAADCLEENGILYLVDAPATFLEKGFTPHIHQNGKKIILEHVIHTQNQVKEAISGSGLKLLNESSLRLDPINLMKNPEFAKFQGTDCLYVLVAKKVKP